MLYVVTANRKGTDMALSRMPKESVINPENGRTIDERAEWVEWFVTSTNYSKEIGGLFTYDTVIVLAVQTLIAEGKISHNDVMFVYVDENGEHIAYPELDGNYGNWEWPGPELLLSAEERYFDAADIVHDNEV